MRRARSAAHPRVGGENEIARAEDVNANGSSPRGRGKRICETVATYGRRLIPAWAGKTAVRRGGGHVRPAHPRVGGENTTAALIGALVPGSSPRGRGKRNLCPLRGIVGGLIPAWAGKTDDTQCRSFSCWAHPRVGGENRTCVRLRNGQRGSSPRGRGKPLRRTRRSLTFSAHPRVGGENAKKLLTPNNGDGSSPRGRGKQTGTIHPCPLRRLIPAWAGKTSAARCGRASKTAHPRVGGENDPGSTQPERLMGSSPRGRGKHPHHRRLRRQSGLIPAWAGKTLSGSLRIATVVAHPRVGGENVP